MAQDQLQILQQLHRAIDGREAAPAIQYPDAAMDLKDIGMIPGSLDDLDFRDSAFDGETAHRRFP